MEEGLRFVNRLLAGEPASLDGESAHIPWIKRAPKVFVAGSGPRTLGMAGAMADGAFVNLGITADILGRSEAIVEEGARQVGRDTAELELWQIASLDCNEDGAAARDKVGAILAFMAGGYIFDTPDLASRGVPSDLHAAMRALRERYSMRPGDADARLVDELGLFDYLAARFAIYGTPDQCLTQLRAAHDAGLKRVMFTVSVASDPTRTVELFGEHVLPRFRELE